MSFEANLILTKKLEELPKVILDQEIGLINLSCLQAEDIRITTEIKSLAKNDAAMNLSFKNEGQRTASVEVVLRENVVYQEKIKQIPIHEKELMVMRVQLEYQKNMLRSYIAIAGME